MVKNAGHDDEIVEWLKASLPDGRYFVTLLSRYKYLILLVGLFTTILAATAYTLVNNKYSSDTSVVIKADNRTIVSRALDPVNIKEHIHSFNLMTKSQKFLGDIYDRMLREGIIKDANLEKEGLVAKAKKEVKKFLLSLNGEVYNSDHEQFNNRLRAIDRLSESFIAYSTETGVLTVEVFFDTPDKAQKMAQLIMNHFIVTELEAEVAFLDRKAQSLKQNMDMAKVSFNQAKFSMKSTFTKEEEEAANRRESEMDLTERVRELTSEINSLNLEKTRTRMALETEVKRLSTMLHPDHPTLVAKRKELMTPSGDDYVETKEKQRDELKTRLRDVRRKATNRDGMAELGLGDTAFNLNLLTNTLNEIEIEKEKVIKDLMNPEESSIFRTIRPPSLIVKPYKNMKAKMALGILTVGGFSILLGIFLGEYFSQKARDEWRIRRIAGKNILARLPRVKIDDIKGEEELLKQWVVGNVPAKIARKGYIQGILENRAFEISLMENCFGKTIFLTELTDISYCSQYIKNFINIFSKDQAKRAAVFDFNFVSPLLPKKLFDEAAKSNLTLTNDKQHGKLNIDYVIGDSIGLNFDYFPIHMAEAGFSFLKKERSKPFFDDIHNVYEWVFIMGFPASFTVENRKLQKFATDTIVFVDCEWTRYAVLKRMVIDLEQQNIRGLALLQSAA